MEGRDRFRFRVVGDRHHHAAPGADVQRAAGARTTILPTGRRCAGCSVPEWAGSGVDCSIPCPRNAEQLTVAVRSMAGGPELLAQDGVDHGVPPCPAGEQVPSDGAFLDHPGCAHGPGGCLVEGAACSPDPVQAEFGEAEAVQEPDGLQALALAPLVGAERESDLAALVLAGVPAARPRSAHRPCPRPRACTRSLGMAVADRIAA